jgi:hypothetical protein
MSRTHRNEERDGTFTETEVVLTRADKGLALEESYWYAMLRILKIYDIDPEPYMVPQIGDKTVSAHDARNLKAFLEKVLHDIPKNDLWAGRGEPDVEQVNPFEYFSGVGISFLEVVIPFLSRGEFSMRVARRSTLRFG